ncbi:MAG: NTP transferase domain-containing protein [Salinivirgaceae bacterium]|nr:NTP transferase domain-containing protein [Salinivirgaceae bacterium]MDD4746326.1 NTP transferase domain-containing protein [Salinivirgaceae bacterium]
MIQNSALILAAGFSKRMGRCKALLKMPYGKTFLEYIVDGFCLAEIPTIVVVVNKDLMKEVDDTYADLKNKCLFVVNENPELGRFSSIKIGLSMIDPFSSVFLHNIDTPFLSLSLLKSMQGAINEADYCLPVFNKKGGHPVLLSSKVVQSINKEKVNDCNLRLYLQQFSSKRVITNESGICLNVNSVESYTSFIENFRA